MVPSSPTEQTQPDDSSIARSPELMNHDHSYQLIIDDQESFFKNDYPPRIDHSYPPLMDVTLVIMDDG